MRPLTLRKQTTTNVQRKLIECLNRGDAIYIKLGGSTMTDLEGRKVDIEVLPDTITYYDTEGNVMYYEK